MEEIWKDIKGYEGLYRVSNLGEIFSIRRNKKMSLRLNKCRGYYDINLIKNKTSKRIHIHRLVAETFISNPNNYPCVNHKDENKTNNYVDNLEWCTYKYNNNYGSAQKKRFETFKKRNIKIKAFQPKIITQYDLNGSFIKNWNSIKEAQNELNISHISEVCNNKRKTAGKYIWRFKE